MATSREKTWPPVGRKHGHQWGEKMAVDSSGLGLCPNTAGFGTRGASSLPACWLALTVMSPRWSASAGPAGGEFGCPTGTRESAPGECRMRSLRRSASKLVGEVDRCAQRTARRVRVQLVPQIALERLGMVA